MKTVIQIENLSKQYIIKHEGQNHGTLRDAITDTFKGMLKSKEAKSKRNESFWALKDINFDIKQGDLVGLIGHNGAGKSTLLKIISRITEPTTGSIKIKGRVASLLEVGTGFHGELTGRENIFLNGTILGMSRAEIRRKLDEIVAFSEIEKFLDTPVKRYSSGMYVRLAFAVAAHLEPEILILDEVLAVGDMEFQKKCLGKMEDVSKNEGRTVLFVSHNMGYIKKLCNKGVLLKKGQVHMVGDINHSVAEYLRPASKDTSNISFNKNDYGLLHCEMFAAEGAGAPTKEVFGDQKTGFRFMIRLSERMRGKIGLGGRLVDAAGNVIGSNFSDYYNAQFSVSNDEITEIELINDGLYLGPGRYIFYPELWCNGEHIRTKVEPVYFEVMVADIFGKGYSSFQNEGPILWDATWQQVKSKALAD